MTIWEATREQRRKMRSRPRKERLAYFWTYYKGWVIALAFVLVLGTYFVIDVATKKDAALEGVFFNVEEYPASEAYLADFGTSVGLDPDSYTFFIECINGLTMNDTQNTEAYYAMQRLQSRTAANDLDILGGDVSYVAYMGYMDYLCDLHTAVSEEELQALDGQIVYIDRALREALYQDDELELTAENMPDPAKPEDMEDPIPVAIIPNHLREDFSRCYVTQGTPAIGIVTTSKRVENAMLFIRYTMGVQ